MSREDNQKRGWQYHTSEIYLDSCIKLKPRALMYEASSMKTANLL
jgi:hypothetical protein